MHPSIMLLLGSLFYVILIIILFYSKPRINLLENKAYQILLINSLIGIILDIAGIYANLLLPETVFIRWLIVKLYFVFLLNFIMFLTAYIYLSIGNKYFLDNRNAFKKYFRRYILFYTFFFLINSILPFNYYNENNIIYVYGLNSYFIFGLAGLFIIFWTIYMILNRKELSIKFMPLIVFIILGTTFVIFQFLFPQLLLITSVISFITVMMYHTIENPDYNMLKQINAAKDQAEKANKAKTDFLSSMSHEIRTPLNAIVGFSEDIIQETDMSIIKSEARDVVSASHTLLEIVNGILDISKIEANKMDLVESEYIIKKELTEIANLIETRLREKSIEFEVGFAPDIPYKLYGDIGKIKQITVNFLTNSVKYTEKGSIKLNVSCINEENMTTLVISVSDTGRGIKKENMDKLFTKFERLDEDRNTTTEGTGLGLAITKSFVELMGGRIAVHSQYNIGSTFMVYLKQKIIQKDFPADYDQNSLKISENLGEYNKFNDKKVLIVDDNFLNIKIALRVLEKHDLKCEYVSRGIECIEKIQAGNHYDIIFMDIMMPKMDGVETLNKLKEINNFNIPTVALTADAISGMREKYIKLGFNDYLSKPMNKDELSRILDNFLKK